MSDLHKHVRRNSPVSKTEVSRAIALGWARTASNVGKGAMADKIDGTTKLIDRTLTGESVPELHTALNSLLADHTALNEVFALYGFTPPRKRMPDAQNDLATVSSLSAVVSTFCGALEDGDRNHQETLALADLLRPLMPALVHILDEANRLRGIAA